MKQCSMQNKDPAYYIWIINFINCLKVGLVASMWCTHHSGLGSIPGQGTNPNNWRAAWASALSVPVPSPENGEGCVRTGIGCKTCTRIKHVDGWSAVATPNQSSQKGKKKIFIVSQRNLWWSRKTWQMWLQLNLE